MIMIQDGSVVTLAYKLKNPDGQLLDESPDNEPLVYLHGGSQIVPGLENALKGLTPGSKKDVVVQPEDGYGEVSPELRFEVKKEQFNSTGPVEVGMQFQAEHPSGQILIFRVEEVKEDTIKVDGNHPLAGVPLHFSVEIIGVRDATAEEKAHGHAHGPDGHHHH